MVRQMVTEIRTAGGAQAIEWLLMDALYAVVLCWPDWSTRVVFTPWCDCQRIGCCFRIFSDWRKADFWNGRRELTCAMYLFASRCAASPLRNSGAKRSIINLRINSTHAFASAWAGYRQWRPRWRIENTGFRELKEGWHLERAPWSYTDDTVVAARVAFALMAFNLAQIAKTAQGRKLTKYGIRRSRRELAAQYGSPPVIVFTPHTFGIFHIEQIVELLGIPPDFSLRKRPPA